MNTPSSPKIGDLQWLDYLVARPRKAMSLVTEQYKRYVEPQGPAWAAYWPLLAGLRRAVNAPDPAAVLDQVVKRVSTRTGDWRGPVYRDCTDGFLDLLPAGVTGVRVTEASWFEAGLEVRLRNPIGLRRSNGDLLVVLPYCKKEPLDQETADLLLGILEEKMHLVLPGATPEIWDLQRGKRFKLGKRTNRVAIHRYLGGAAAGYVQCWMSLAA